jgi:hypothetical protein
LKTSSSNAALIEIPLSKGYFAVIDADDADLVNQYKWYAETPRSRNVYAARNFRVAEGRSGIQYLHSFISGYPMADHINGNGLDNRRENLRDATPSQNCYNAPIRRDSSSGFKGVSPCKQTGRWQVRISANGRNRRIGRYRTAEEAARAYDEAARNLHGLFARLNFPEPGEQPARKAA